jgi:hypothetical protein
MKRINPNTNKIFKRGDLREDGFVFCAYGNIVKKDGMLSEKWFSPDVYNREYQKQKNYRNKKSSTLEGHVTETLNRAKGRAKKQNVPFAVTLEYLVSIAPKKCPILGIELAWGRKGETGYRHDSPSLDKIVPELGYVAGNVQWLSNKANTMKHNATPEELKLFAKWILSQ